MGPMADSRLFFQTWDALGEIEVSLTVGWYVIHLFVIEFLVFYGSEVLKHAPL
jgi:high-affinity nickel permease